MFTCLHVFIDSNSDGDFDDVPTSKRVPALFGPFLDLFGPYCQNNELLTFFEVTVIVVSMMCQPANVFGPFRPFLVFIGSYCQNNEIFTFFAVTAIAMVISIICQAANMI